MQPPILHTADARLQRASRLDISLLKLCREAIHKAKASSFMRSAARFATHTHHSDFARDTFFPAIGMRYCAIQTQCLSTNSQPTNQDDHLTVNFKAEYNHLKQFMTGLQQCSTTDQIAARAAGVRLFLPYSQIKVVGSNRDMLHFLSYGLNNFSLTWITYNEWFTSIHYGPKKKITWIK